MINIFFVPYFFLTRRIDAVPILVYRQEEKVFKPAKLYA